MDFQKSIVINKCYGGFSLSYKGVMHYAKLKGIRLYAFTASGFPSKFTPHVPGENPYLIHYSTKPLNEKGQIPDKAYFSDRAIERDDPFLVQTVKELGSEAASGSCAELTIVQVPVEVKWQIEEYDGNEHIAEEHRTWS